MTTIRGSIVKITEFLRILVVVYSHRFYTDILWWAYEIDDCNRFKGLNDKFYLFCWQWLLCIISLVHYVNASGRVCVGNEFKLEFGHQFDVTSTNMADVVLPSRRRRVRGLERRADVHLMQGHRCKYVARIQNWAKNDQLWFMFIQHPMAYTDTFPKEKKPKNTNYNINWTQTEK